MSSAQALSAPQGRPSPALAATGRRPSRPLSIEVISSFGDLVRLEDEWNRLVEASDVAHPFLTHDWIRSWWEAFGSEAQPHLLVARAAGAPAAIAPIMRTRRRMYGMMARCLELMVNPHTPRSGFITDRSRPEARRAILEHLLERSGEWDVLILSQVPLESPLVEEIRLLCRQRNLLHGLWPSSRSPYVETTGDWNSYQAGLRRKHRSNLRTRLSRLRSLGDVGLEIVDGGPRLATAVEEGLRIEASAWKADAGSAILSEPGSALFYRRLAVRAALRGSLAFRFLTVGGRRVAFHYSLLHGNRLFLLKPGYDPEFRPYSPGSVLCHLALEDAFSRGISEMDLAGDSDEWKMQWTSKTRAHGWTFVFPARLRPRLIHSAKFRLAPWIRSCDPLGKVRAGFRRAVAARSR